MPWSHLLQFGIDQFAIQGLTGAGPELNKSLPRPTITYGSNNKVGTGVHVKLVNLTPR